MKKFTSWRYTLSNLTFLDSQYPILMIVHQPLQPVVVFDSILLLRTAFFLCNSGRVVFHHIVYYCVLHRRHTLLHIWLFLLVLLVQGSHFIFRLVPFKVVDISWDKLPTPKSVVGSILTMVLDVGYLSLSIHHSIWMHIDRCRALPLLHSKFLIT